MKRREFLAGLLAATGVAAGFSIGQEPDTKQGDGEQGDGEQGGWKLGPHPRDAVQAAAAALGGFALPQFVRFIWYPLSADPVTARNEVDALNLAANFALCHADEMQPLQHVGAGTFAVDLSRFAGGNGERIAKLEKAWEGFAGTVPGADDHDPIFLTNSVQQIGATDAKLESVRVVADSVQVWATEVKKDAVAKLDSGDERLRLLRGQTFELFRPWDHAEAWCVCKFPGGLFGIVEKTAVVLEPVLLKTRVPAPYLGEEMQAVMLATASGAPIVHGGEFIRRGLGQVDDGLYYDFRGFSRGPKGGPTDFDRILQEITGLTFAKCKELRGVQSAFVSRSKVTDGQRVVWLFQGGHTKPGTNQGLIGVSGDARGNRPDHEKPWATLDEFRPDAMEVLIELPSGVIAYLLFSGYDNDPKSETFGEFLGQLQDEAPPFIARDVAAPGAADSRIDGAFDCLRCHVVHNDGRGPWIVYESDLGRLLRSGETDVATVSGLKNPERLARLSGELRARAWGALTTANSHASGSLMLLSEAAGGPGNAGKLEENETTARRQIGALVSMYKSWEHDSVDAAEALRRAGVVVGPEDDGREMFSQLVPRVPGQVRYAAELRSGVEISPRAWRAVAVDLIWQVTKNSGRVENVGNQ